jgi:hypothetical protein
MVLQVITPVRTRSVLLHPQILANEEPKGFA